MAKLTSKGPKRAGNALAAPEDSGEVRNDPDQQFGDGEIGADGPGAQGEPVAESKTHDWAGLIEAVRSEPAQVSRAWHPAPKGQVIELKNGSNAAVEVGAPAYQLTTGDIITL